MWDHDFLYFYRNYSCGPTLIGDLLVIRFHILRQ